MGNIALRQTQSDLIDAEALALEFYIDDGPTLLGVTISFQGTFAPVRARRDLIELEAVTHEFDIDDGLTL